MKKTGWMIPVVLLIVGIAAGCGNQSTSQSKSNSSEKISTKSSSKKTEASSDSSSSDTSSSSDESSSASTFSDTESTSSSTKKPTISRITELNQQIHAKLTVAKLPTTVSTATGKVLNAAISGTNEAYTVNYSEGSQEVALNVASVAPILELTKKTYSTAAAAQSQINYQQIQKGLPTVSLGYGMTATQEGAAGSSYTTWHEGNWSITVVSSNVQGEDGLPLAKQAAAYFNRYALPAPDGQATVQLYVAKSSDLMNVITWRKGTALYTASGTDAMKLLQAAVTIR
ncbi:hypothetical protein [Lacticaseibacillus mingshuiensis]|uniref:Lipoprotein n=1 Tax=Lacticaseibacillus mingshuiensis TaxID=2799574 RepID=A0ABW4CHM5_9LACO|nr:hypothetical protein [Lacticaseibacillus mingshuiensis]